MMLTFSKKITVLSRSVLYVEEFHNVGCLQINVVKLVVE